MHPGTGNGDANLKKWLVIATVSTILLAAAMFLLIFCTKPEPKPIAEQNASEQTEPLDAEETAAPEWHIETGSFYISESGVACGTEMFSAPEREVFDEILLTAKKDGKLRSAEDISAVKYTRGTVKLTAFFDEDCYLTDADVEKAIDDAVKAHLADSTKGMPNIVSVSISSENSGTTRCYVLDYSSAPTVSAEATRRDENGIYVRSAACAWALDEEIDSETANKLVKYVRDNFLSRNDGEGAILHVSLRWKNFDYERDIICTEENEETVNAVAGFILRQAHRHDAEAANLGFMSKEGRVK